MALWALVRNSVARVRFSGKDRHTERAGQTRGGQSSAGDRVFPGSLYLERRNSQSSRIFQEQDAKLFERSEFFCVLFRFGISCRFVEFPVPDIATGNTLSPALPCPLRVCPARSVCLSLPENCAHTVRKLISPGNGWTGYIFGHPLIAYISVQAGTRSERDV